MSFLVQRYKHVDDGKAASCHYIKNQDWQETDYGTVSDLEKSVLLTDDSS